MNHSIVSAKVRVDTQSRFQEKRGAKVTLVAAHSRESHSTFAAPFWRAYIHVANLDEGLYRLGHIQGDRYRQCMQNV